MISLACQWTQSPSATPLQPIKYMLLFGLCSLMISQAGWWTRTPSATSLQPTKMKSSFLYYIQLLMLARLVDGLKPHPPPISSQKNEMLIFVLHWTSDDKPGWLMDLNPICHPSPDKKMNAHIWIMFNFWWSAGLVEGLKPHPPPLCPQKNEMLIFGLRSTSDDWPGWSMDWNHICHLSPAKNMKCSFLYYIQHLMLARLVNGLEPHPPLLSSQKYEKLIFGLCSTSDDQLGWSVDSNPIHHPSPAKKMKCSFFDYVQLLMISWAGQWT